MTVEAKFPSLKKSVIAGDKDYADQVGDQAKIDRKYMFKEPKNEDEEGEVFDKEELTSAYYYGKQLVPVSDIDKLAMKESTEKGITLLGTRRQANILASDISGNALLVQPQPNDSKASLAVSALCQALENEELAMIVRYVAKTNATPKLCAMLPTVYKGVACFCMVAMPFYEDQKDLCFPAALPKASSLQSSAADALIDAYDLDAAESELGRPEVTANPVLHHFRTIVTGRSSDPEAALPECDAAILAAISSFEGALVAKALVAFKECHPTERTFENIEKKRSAFGLDDDEVPVASEPKKVKTEDEAPTAEVTMDSLMASQPSESLRVRPGEPIEDFKAMVRRTDVDLWHRAVKELGEVLQTLVVDSVKDLNYAKVLKCILGFREICISDANKTAAQICISAKSYNEFLVKTQKMFMHGGRAPFWEQVTKSQCHLISRDEDAASTYSKEEALSFFNPAPVAVSAPVAVVDDDDDLLDDLD